MELQAVIWIYLWLFLGKWVFMDHYFYFRYMFGFGTHDYFTLNPKHFSLQSTSDIILHIKRKLCENKGLWPIREIVQCKLNIYYIHKVIEKVNIFIQRKAHKYKYILRENYVWCISDTEKHTICQSRRTRKYLRGLLSLHV